MASQVGLDRATVLQRAADLADADGLEALSMAQLARSLGVRPPALYHYVPNLAGLRRELALRGLAQVGEQISRAAIGKAGDAAVRAAAHALRTFASEHPGLYAAASRAPDRSDRVWVAAGADVVELLIRTLDAYALSDAEARQIVRMLRSIVHGCVGLERSDGFGVPGEGERTFAALLAALLASLSHPDGATR